MIAPDRDRLELSHLIENSEYRQRLMLMEELLEAVRAAGEWPRIGYSQHQYGIGPRYTCQHCYAHAPSRDALRHVQRCPGERIADALAAIEARVTEVRRG